MHQELTVPLSQLVFGKANVRRTDKTVNIDQLAASIRAEGLLQNLVVRQLPTGKFEVTAGNRRLRALRTLEKSGNIGRDYGVRVLPADADPAAVGLAENTIRQAMHPADEFEAFQALIAAGETIESIAARFGVSILHVRRRLKLAALSPRLIRAYRKGEASLDQLMALAIVADHGRQNAAFFGVPDYARQPQAIKRRLTEGRVSGHDRRVRFVGLDPYEAAGGTVTRDLFASEEEIWIEDVNLLDQLAITKLEAVAADIAGEGWKWTEIDLTGALRQSGSFATLPPERRAPHEAEASAITTLNQELEDIAGQMDVEDVSDEHYAVLDQRSDELRDRLAAMEESLNLWTDEQKAEAGAIIALGADGAPAVHRGLARPQDIRKAKTRQKQDSGPNADPAADRDQATSIRYSAAVVQDLTARRTIALALELAKRPELALAALVHDLVLSTLYERWAGQAAMTGISASTFEPRRFIADDEVESAAAEVDAAAETWKQQLPEVAGHLWTWLSQQPADRLLNLLAFCVARTLDTVEARPDQGRSGKVEATLRLASAVNLDMRQHWQPTSAFLAKLPKSAIVAALHEACPEASQKAPTGLKKVALVKQAVPSLTTAQWLPVYLRGPQASGPHEQNPSPEE
jgi:ParB family chromosome partitioning protein